MSAGPRPIEPRRVLVTLHLPLDMGVVGRVLSEIAEKYPQAVMGEEGKVWNRRLAAGERSHV